jgi:hypothetical protein
MRIRSVLDRRLGASVMAGYSGDLRFTFYRDGLRMLFEAGRLRSVESWREDHAWGPRAQAGFPPLVFLKLLFGYQGIPELRRVFPDVYVNAEVRTLVEALFPPLNSWLLPLD